jgi:hypothetical protein
VESLGYSLVSLACGGLPWTYNVHHGTRETQHDQVQIKKQRYSGADLATNRLPCIGEMTDYARSLKFDQLPNYELLHSQIRKTRQWAGLLDSFTVKWHLPAEASSVAPSSFTIGLCLPLQVIRRATLCPMNLPSSSALDRSYIAKPMFEQPWKGTALEQAIHHSGAI